MDIVLYSTDCPKCKVLKKKLEEKNIKYTVESDEEKMLLLDIMTVPVLSVDKTLMSFADAVKWLNNYNEGQTYAD